MIVFAPYRTAYIYRYTLNEKPYFPSPRMSRNAQKDQVNIIF